MADPMLVVLLGQVQRVVQVAYDELERTIGNTPTPPPAVPWEALDGEATALVEWGGRHVICRVNITLETPLTPAELPVESDDLR